MSKASTALATAPDTARRWGVLWVAAGAALWGTDPVLRRPLASHFRSSQIVAAEHLILSCILLPVLWRSRAEWLRLGPRQWAAILGISCGGSALATVFFTEAIKTGNPTSAVFLQKIQPLFAALFARLLLHERLGTRFWFHAALALCGAYLVSFGFQPALPAIVGAQRMAAALAIGSAALWAGSTVLGRFVLDRTSFPALTALRITTATPLLLVLALAGSDGTILGRLTGAQLVSLLLMALIPGLAALLLYYRGLGRTRASLAAIAELSFPAIAMLLNWIFLDARITAVQLAGFILLWCVIFHLETLGKSRPHTSMD
jgi:drug/metabolite transporter (DMT)-like permease